MNLTWDPPRGSFYSGLCRPWAFLLRVSRVKFTPGIFSGLLCDSCTLKSETTADKAPQHKRRSLKFSDVLAPFHTHLSYILTPLSLVLNEMLLWQENKKVETTPPVKETFLMLIWNETVLCKKVTLPRQLKDTESHLLHQPSGHWFFNSSCNWFVAQGFLKTLEHVGEGPGFNLFSWTPRSPLQFSIWHLSQE